MNLIDLKAAVENTIQKVKEDGRKPEDIRISIQIDCLSGCGECKSAYTDSELELSYDNDCQVSGCVLWGNAESIL